MNNIKTINSNYKFLIFFATLFIILIYAGCSQSQSQQSPNIKSSNFNSTIYNELPPRDFSDEEQKLRNLIVDQEYNSISKIEQYYNKKNKGSVKLQGYEYFKNNFQFYDYQRPLTTGSLQDEYVMGIGDVLNFVLQGGRNETFKKTVNKDGVLYLDFTTPISALGRTFGELKKEIYARGKSSLTETNIYISVDKIRNINIEVTGEVNLPGSYNVSSLSSVLDVLLIAGGIKKTGTLRRVKVINGKNVKYIDLYQFLFGLDGEIQVQNVLNNKSIIVVPPIGKTVAASGSFLRGGIYEILENLDNVKNLINYAGGFSEPGNFFITRQSILANNLKNNVGIVQKNDKLRDGDVFFSHSQDNYLNPSVELIGSVKSPGMYPYKEFDDLLKLLPNNISLNADTYKLSILIERINRKTLRKEFINKEIKNIIFKEDNFPLEENDKIYVFTHKDLEFLSSSIMMQLFFSTYDDENLFSQNCKTLEKFSKLVRERTEASSIKYFFLKNHFNNLKKTNTNSSNKIQTTENETKNRSYIDSETKDRQVSLSISKDRELVKDCQNIPEIFRDRTDLLLATYDNIKIVKGFADNPGIYLFDDKANFNDLLDYVGAKTKNYILSPDKKTIDIKSNSIKVEGAVKFPSELTLISKLTLRDILKNSDYFLDDTYPFFGLIERVNKSTGVRKLITFNPSNILSGLVDIELFSSDQIRLFKFNEIKLLSDFHFNNINQVITSELIDTKNHSPNTNNLVTDTNNDDNVTLINNKDTLSFDDNSSLNNNIKNLNGDLDAQSSNSVNEITNKPKKIKIDESSDNNASNNICKNFSYWLNEKPNLCGQLLYLTKEMSVLVSGEVKSPGYYIIGNYVDANGLIQLAGGFTNDADIINLEISNISENFQNSQFLYPGGKLFIKSLNSKNSTIKLVGAFQKERELSFKPYFNINNIITSIRDLDQNAYLYFATIERKNSIYGENILFPFSPFDVLNNRQSFELKSGDKIKIFTKKEINQLISFFPDTQSIPTPQLDFNAETNLPNISGSLKELVKSLSIRVEGSIGKPGQLLIASKLELNKIIEIAGGVNNNSNKNIVEVTFPQRDEIGNFNLSSLTLSLNKSSDLSYLVVPGSLIRFPQVTNDLSLGFVELNGAVLQPGKYRILKNDSMYEILKRSGGLAENAYLKGLVFSRIEEKQREIKSISRLKKELEKAVLVAIENQDSSNKVNLSDVGALRELILSANQFDPIGRVIGNFDNIETLKNTKVLSGDKIYIPFKSNSITVIGEVMSPGSIIWNPNSSSTDYIKKAAGFTDLAESKKVFIISPNGQASRKGGLWTSNNSILPGSTIVIPRRIRLSSNLDKISAITSVIYQLTVTLAGIDNLLSD